MIVLKHSKLSRLHFVLSPLFFAFILLSFPWNTQEKLHIYAKLTSSMLRKLHFKARERDELKNIHDFLIVFDCFPMILRQISLTFCHLKHKKLK